MSISNHIIKKIRISDDVISYAIHVEGLVDGSVKGRGSLLSQLTRHVGRGEDKGYRVNEESI